MRKHNLIVTLLLFISASLWPFAIAAAQGGEEPQIRITQVDNSKFLNVIVYLSATYAAGEPVGIDPSAIQIYENGQLMQLSCVKLVLTVALPDRAWRHVSKYPRLIPFRAAS